jgi:formylmethanofuran dehydrogenase subunit C
MAESSGLSVPQIPSFIMGKITQVNSTTSFLTTLRGYGDAFFQDWDVYVGRDSAGGGAAPQGDREACNSYVSATGAITIDAAFDTASPAVGDTIILMHPFLGENTLIIDWPSDDLKQSDDTEVTTAAGVLTQVKSLAWTGKVGGCRVKFDMYIDPGGGTASAVVYKNGVAVVTNPLTIPNYTTHTDITGVWVTFSQDIFGLVTGDLIQVYAMAAGGTTHIKNFRIYYNILYQPAVQAILDSVYYDEANGVSGTDWPIGTAEMPSNNFTDTMAIALDRHIQKITLLGGGTFTISTDNFNKEIIGSEMVNVTIAVGVDGTYIVNGLTCQDFTNNGVTTQIRGHVNCHGVANAATGTLLIHGNIFASHIENAGNMILEGDVELEASSALEGYIQNNGDLVISGDVSALNIDDSSGVGQNLSIYGDVKLDYYFRKDDAGDLIIWGNLRVRENLELSGVGPVVIYGECIIGGFTNTAGADITLYSLKIHSDFDNRGGGDVTIAADAYVAGNLRLDGTTILDIDGNLSVRGYLQNAGTGAISIDGNCDLGDHLTSLSGTITIRGDFKSGDYFSVSSATVNIYGNFFASNDIVKSGANTMTVYGNAICSEISNQSTGVIYINGNLQVQSIVNSGGGDITINGNLECHGGFDNTGGDDIGVLGDCYIGGTLTMTTAASTFTVYGNMRANGITSTSTGAININGNLIVEGNLTINAAGATLTIDNGCFVSGTLTTGNTATVTIYGDTYIYDVAHAGSGLVFIAGNVEIGTGILSNGGGAITVNGNVSIASNWNNTGGGNIIITGAETSITGTLTINGADTLTCQNLKCGVIAHGSTAAMAVNGNLLVTGTTTVSAAAGSLTVNGNALLVGAVGATNATSVITIYGIAQIYGAITATGTVAYHSHIECRDFWSNPQEEVAVPAVAADQAMPDIVVAGIPTTSRIVDARLMFKFRVVENTNVAANKLNGAQDIQIRTDAPGAWADGINFLDDMFGIAASTIQGGDVFIGDINLNATVTGDDTYNTQWDEAIADVASLNFNDVQVGLRIWYSV